MNDPYGEINRLNEEIERLMAEKRQLQARVGELERELRMRPRGRRKGAGAHYAARIIRLNRDHRRLLFYLLAEGAVDGSIAVPMVHLKRKYRLPTGPTAGRMAELIGKGLVGCHRVPITFQPDSEGVMRYRPATEIDPALGVKRYRRFTYWLTPEGREALRREVKPSDDFVRAMPNLDVLAELKKAVEGRVKEQSSSPEIGS